MPSHREWSLVVDGKDAASEAYLEGTRVSEDAAICRQGLLECDGIWGGWD